MIKPWDFIAVKLTLFLVLGILLGRALEIQPWASGILAGIGLCILGIAAFKIPKRSYLFGGSALFTALSTGILLYSLAFQPNLPGHYSQYDITGSHLWQLKVLEIDNSSNFSQAYIARVLLLDQHAVHGKIRLRIRHASDSTKKVLNIDDEVLAWGNATKPTSALNPYQWDYSRYLRNQNIYHQLLLKPAQVYKLEDSRSTLRGWSHRIRDHVLSKLETVGLGEKELSIVKALLLGQRRDIAPATFDQYRRAGAVHILAISGLHIGILLMILRALFHPLTMLPWGRGISLWLTVLILWAYALVAGFGPSVVRAVTMFSFLAYSVFLNRPSQGYNTLALSMFFLLVLVDPYLIFQVGFQMSYAAVMAILWVYPILLKLWGPRIPILKRAWQLIAVSLSAQMGVLPISLYYFHQFPALFLISSLIIVPFLGLILGSGIAVTALSLLGFLPELIVRVFNQLIACMNGFVEWLSRQDTFFFDDLPFNRVEVVLWYALLASLVFLIKKPVVTKLRNVLIILMLMQGYGIYTGHITRQTQHAYILHQFGNSTLVHQQGKELRVYGKKATSGFSPIKDFQLGARIEKIKYLPLENHFVIKGNSLVRIDSSETYITGVHNGMLWLTHSPRINLDRYIAYCDPMLIIADGSNYHYLVERWKESAAYNKIPFHFTGDSGAFSFDLYN